MEIIPANREGVSFEKVLAIVVAAAPSAPHARQSNILILNDTTPTRKFSTNGRLFLGRWTWSPQWGETPHLH